MLKHLYSILILNLFLASCGDRTYYLDKEEKGLMFYEKGEKFKLINKKTNDTIEFTVTKKEFTQTEREEFNEVSCNISEMEFSLDSTIHGGFSITKCSPYPDTRMYLLEKEHYYSCYQFSEKLQSVGTVTLLNKTFDDVYVIGKENSTLYFSAEEGFLRLEQYSWNDTILYEKAW